MVVFLSADVERHVKCWIRVTHASPYNVFRKGDRENCITSEQANQICYGTTLAARVARTGSERNKTLAKAKTMVSIIK